MANSVAAGLLVHFDNLTDPRSPHGKIHSLKTVLTVALIAMICGSDEWTEIEEFGKAKEKLFRDTFGVAQRGIPSHDTFGRVFGMLCPTAFQECFVNWAKTLTRIAGHIAIDGKTLCGSFDTFSGELPDHIVSAYGSESGLVLAQIATDKKSNEITAIPQLLRLLELRGCTVTIDAMGTQTPIAEQITDSQANYVLAVKANQPELSEEVGENFEKVGVQDDAQMVEKLESDHGRVEHRVYTLCPVKDYLTPQVRGRWSQVATMVMVDNHTEFVNGRRKGQTRSERRFFITNLGIEHQRQIVKSIRSHWGIENSVHYILDVAFGEDGNRTRTKNAAVNQAVVRHYALNLLKLEKTAKVGIKTKRKKAGWDDQYLLKLLRAA